MNPKNFCYLYTRVLVLYYIITSSLLDNNCKKIKLNL